MNDQHENVQASRRTAKSREASSYRERLESKPMLAEHDEAGTEPSPNVEALDELITATEPSGAAFQSVAIAAVQILERALCYEKKASDAALSLGQREKLQSMVQTAENAVATLRNALGSTGSKVMHLCGQQTESIPDDQPWWFALNDALEVLEEGTRRMASLTTAQPDGSPSRDLSEQIAKLLRGHHDALLVEAEQWIS